MGFNASNWERGAGTCQLAPSNATFAGFRDAGGDELRVIGDGQVNEATAGACFFRLPSTFTAAPPPEMFFACLVAQPVPLSSVCRTGIFVADEANISAPFYPDGIIVGSETGAVLTPLGWVASSEDADMSTSAVMPSQVGVPVLVVVRVVNGRTSVFAFSPSDARTELAFNASAVAVATRPSVASGSFTLAKMRRIALVGAQISAIECRVASTFAEATTNLAVTRSSTNAASLAPTAATTALATTATTTVLATTATTTMPTSATTPTSATATTTTITVSAVISMPKDGPASDSTALIAGVVAAIVGVIIFAIVVVALVCRRRTGQPSVSSNEMMTARSEYQTLPVPRAQTAAPDYANGNLQNPD